MGTIRVGVSGWSYPGWYGSFYPADMSKRCDLEFASTVFPSIEINGSFYCLLSPETYGSWYLRTPSTFVFAIKGSRFITHNKKLRDCEIPLANFLASGVLRLREKLGPFVWQLPANLHFDEDRIAKFLDMLPRDTHSAACLARHHDRRVRGQSSIDPGRRRRLRHAVEVRHESYFVPAFVRLLRRAGVALVVSDAADWPLREDVTAGFVYMRLHGSRVTYGSRYSPSDLERWAGRIRAWSEGGEPRDARKICARHPTRRTSRDVYVYFDNDAPNDAVCLARMLDLQPAGRRSPNRRRSRASGPSRHGRSSDHRHLRTDG